MTDPIIAAARFLAEHLEWLRHQPFADEFLGDVDAAARVMRSVARGPRDKQFLGLCGAEVTWDADGNEIPRDQPCAGHVFGDAKHGTCDVCKARWDDVEKRLARLDDVRRGWLFSAREIGDAYEINVKTIRSWYDRGQLAAHGYDPAGVPLHKIGEVLDLAAADKARREEARAKRARRKEAA